MERHREPLETSLLRVLHIVLTEQSVSRAAIKLGLSQPAISNSLRRLRDITGDALLVRGVRVLDIFSPTQAKEHKLTSFARVDGRRITYPPENAD